MALSPGQEASCRAMHTFWQRVNAIFFYALSVLGFLALLCAGTTYFHTAHPDVQLGLDRASLCAHARAVARRARAHTHLTVALASARTDATDARSWARATSRRRCG